MNCRAVPARGDSMALRRESVFQSNACLQKRSCRRQDREPRRHASAEDSLVDSNTCARSCPSVREAAEAVWGVEPDQTEGTYRAFLHRRKCCLLELEQAFEARCCQELCAGPRGYLPLFGRVRAS